MRRPLSTFTLRSARALACSGSLLVFGAASWFGTAVAAQETTARSQLDPLIEGFTKLRGNALGGGEGGPPSFDEVDQRAYRAHALIAQLERLDRSALDATEQQTLDVMLWEARVITEEPSLFWYDSPLMPSRSPLRGVRERAAAAPLTGREEAAAFLVTVRQAVDALDWIDTVERGRLARGIVLPAEQIDRVLPLVRGFADEAEQHPLWPDGDRLND